MTKELSEEKVIKKRVKKFQSVRGMKDVLPNEQKYWDKVRRAFEKTSFDFDFGRIYTPAIEDCEIFERTAGATADIISKEMYKFKTQGGDLVALRPEGTAGVVRAYIENGFQSRPKPVKLCYLMPMYRYERPQEGRYREHFQVGFEAIGEQDAILDVQMIQIGSQLLKILGIKPHLKINSIGCRECRPAYKKLLVSYLKNIKDSLCMDCKKRLIKNPLRVLDCKEEKCSRMVNQAPQSADHLCKECADHFKMVEESLKELGTSYEVDYKLVRGLDYYTKTVFEFWSKDFQGEGQSALGGGGRYDYLVETLGGPETPAVGFSLGVERNILEMKRLGIKIEKKEGPKVYLAQLGELAKRKSLKLFEKLEKGGILVAESFGRGGLKAQLKHANKLKVDFVLIIGQREALDETVILKDMESGSQEVMTFEKIVLEVKKRIKKNKDKGMVNLIDKKY